MSSIKMSFRLRGCRLLLGLLAVAGCRCSFSQAGRAPLATVPPSGDVAAAPATVTGTVVNANSGMPIPRVLVAIGDRAVLTDHDGKFEFDQFSGSGGMVRATKPGYYFSLDSADPGGLYLSASQMSGPLRLRLYPEALLTGRVTAPDGSPLLHVPVGAVRSEFDENGHRWIPAGWTSTNAHGEFRVPVPAGEYRLETRYVARPEIGQDAVMPVEVPDTTSSNTSDIIRIHSGEEQHFDLHPAMGKSYVVSVDLEGMGSGQGYPMIQARMANGALFPANALPRGPGSTVARLGLPSGSYTLSATRSTPAGIEQAETSVTVADHDVGGVVMRFSPVPLVPVEMTVDAATSDNAAPPNLMSLGLMFRTTEQNTDQGMSMGYPTQQKDGTVVFHISPGSYRLEARNGSQWYVEAATYGDRDLLRQEMVVAPGAGGTVPIQLTVSNRTGSIEGNVSLDGAPGNCWVYLIAADPSATPVITLRSNSTTGYRATVAPGSYQAIAFEDRHSADYSDAAALAPYAGHVRTMVIHAGDKTTLDLDAVTAAEIVP